ncbi:MAG: hypothetical protein BJ554DRAFT_4754, partial [Olpidium bornovanus]
LPIGDLLGELSALRVNASRCETRAAAVGRTRGPLAAPPPFLAEIRALTHVPIVGDFSAYRDGRLRVVFEDCCVLDLFPAFDRNPPGPLSAGGPAGDWRWRLVHRDGTVAVTRFENPVGMERCVKLVALFLFPRLGPVSGSDAPPPPSLRLFLCGFPPSSRMPPLPTLPVHHEVFLGQIRRLRPRVPQVGEFDPGGQGRGRSRGLGLGGEAGEAEVAQPIFSFCCPVNKKTRAAYGAVSLSSYRNTSIHWGVGQKGF